MRFPMPTVTLSPKFQVVIPREVRERLSLEPGERIQVFAYAGRIEMVPVRKISKLRGFLAGISTDLEREPDRT
jgi:AbrB family looped-hinge helix DNA binding protein